MSVKKMGSRLAQGVRQVKVQQNGVQPDMDPASVPVIPVAKMKSARVAVKPVSAKAGESSVLHPNRVWPD